MKAGLLALVALSAVSAQPHRRHAQIHEKRDVVVVEATQVEYATVTAPAVIVYVDQNGNPIQETEPTSAPAVTSTPEPVAPTVNVAAAQPLAENGHNVGFQHQPDTTTTTSEPAYTPPPAPTTTEAAPAPAPVTPTEAPAAPAPVPEQPAYSAPAAAEPSVVSSGSSSGVGITYSPYNEDHTCKSAAQVKTDIEALQGGHTLIRLYGADCNQVANVIAAAKPLGHKLFLGIYDITSIIPTIPTSEIATLISAVNGDWSIVDTVSVGNEGVNDGKYTIAAVGIAVASVKASLLLAGYSGPVVAVDTFMTIINNPAYCAVGDYVAANCHAYFDGGISSDGAGTFVSSQAQRLAQVCGGKKVVITESGWPWKGDTNGKAVASTDDQNKAINSLQQSLPNGLILFNAYNDNWKSDSSATFNAEKHWGMQGNAPSGP